ncbi:unnamed protein product [Arabis nemorensis]|uniref:Auxin-responsive protein n=1 Tax=Arabis nemorensis TaxID=586526 RepID=A0A565AWQ8_9BRAS|nr:unnamed protein product [Arabis nemorensis]
MAKKWQQRAALKRKRISVQRTNTSASFVEKGCFVVYTADKTRFAFPISYLSNYVFQELLKISEEEFGIPSGGPITLPFDSVFLEYLIKLIERQMDGDMEKAVLMSISSVKCSLQQQHQSTQQLLYQKHPELCIVFTQTTAGVNEKKKKQKGCSSYLYKYGVSL